MTTNGIYDYIVANMPPGIEKTVMIVLASGHVGNQKQDQPPRIDAKGFWSSGRV